MAMSRCAAAVALVTLIGSCSASSALPTTQDAAKSSFKLPREAPPRQLADDDTGDSLTSIGKTVLNALINQLQDNHFQWCNALTSLVCGVLLVVNGDIAFRGVMIAGIFFVATLITLHEIRPPSSLAFSPFLRHFVSVEAGALCAFAAFKGIDGLMIAIGGVFGAVIAFQAETAFLTLGCVIFETNKAFVGMWYSLFILGFMLILKNRRHSAIVAVISPLLGGLLTASAVSWFITQLALHGVKFSASQGSPPVQGSWVDFVMLLMSSGVPDVGIFANSPSSGITVSGKFLPADRIMGCLLWFLLFVVGLKVQLTSRQRIYREWSKNAPINKKVVPDPSKKISDLQVPILKHVV